MASIRAVLISVAALLLAGCPGSDCARENPRVNAVQSCTVAPGATVTVQVRTCTTCNQASPSCSVDLSAAEGSHQIFLDTLATACESVSSCDTSSCPSTNSLAACTFTAPAGTGSYTLMAHDPVSGTISAMLTVASGPSSCAFSFH